MLSSNLSSNLSIVDVREVATPVVELVEDEDARFEQFLGRYRQIKDKDTHIALRNALIEHLWLRYANNEDN